MFSAPQIAVLSRWLFSEEEKETVDHQVEIEIAATLLPSKYF